MSCSGSSDGSDSRRREPMPAAENSQMVWVHKHLQHHFLVQCSSSQRFPRNRSIVPDFQTIAFTAECLMEVDVTRVQSCKWNRRQYVSIPVSKEVLKLFWLITMYTMRFFRLSHSRAFRYWLGSEQQVASQKSLLPKYLIRRSLSGTVFGFPWTFRIDTGSNLNFLGFLL